MNLFKNLQIYNESINSTVQKIAIQVRKEMVDKYGIGTNLAGRCIEASDRIVELLNEKGIEAKTVEGWCIFDDDSYGSDRPYDEHTWVELENGTYIDVTAEQFNPGMWTENELPEIIVGTKPECMVYDEPELDEEGYIIGREY